MREKVFIRRVPSYDPDIIEQAVDEGLKTLGINGNMGPRVTIKPNIVMAHHRVAPSAYTRPELVDGLLRVLKKNAGPGQKIVIAEKTGCGLPTIRMFRRAGYFSLKKKHPVSLVPIEEAQKTTVNLKKGTLHHSLRTAKAVTDTDFLIFAPKLKSNVLAGGLTAALKLNIGIYLDRQRMWNHNHRLPEKIVDALEVSRPCLIVTDAVEISLGGNQMTQHGRHLGVIIMAVNPVAHDAVCARILNLDPKNIPHLRLASSRGYGPLDIQDIQIEGDVGLPELQEKTREWENGFKRVDQLDVPLNILCGQPYCSGGCHGVFLDWIYMIKDRSPKLWDKLPSLTVVLGQYDGDVTAEKVVVIGSCSGISGTANAKHIRKIRGCPPAHKSLVLWLFLKAGIRNPLFRLDLIMDGYLFLFLSRLRRLIRGRW